jgi:hypothetical protein
VLHLGRLLPYLPEKIGSDKLSSFFPPPPVTKKKKFYSLKNQKKFIFSHFFQHFLRIFTVSTLRCYKNFFSLTNKLEYLSTASLLCLILHFRVRQVLTLGVVLHSGRLGPYP